MKYKKIGNKKVSIMGFGGIPIMSGREGGVLVQLKDVDYEASLNVIESAYRYGINFFDTALDYGDSEEKIGKALHPFNDRENIFLASKSKALTYDDMMFSVETSLKRLKTDYLDLYQLHYVKDKYSYKTIMGKNGAYSALEKLKKDAVIQNIGVASHNIYVLDDAVESEYFDTIQLPLNIIEQDSIEIIQKANSKKIATIIMKPFAGGSLTKRIDKIFDYIESDYHLRILALKFIFQFDITTVIPGMSNLTELNENLAFLEELEKLTPKEIKQLQKIKESIGTTFCRRCQYCEPSCPAQIKISQVLRFDKYYEDYGLKEWAKKQYDSLTNKADQCLKCHMCESKCPYSLQIVDKLEEIRKKMEGMDA